MERKRKHTTSPDFNDDSADSDPAYMHGKQGLCLSFFVIFPLLYMLAQLVVFRQTMAHDPKTFNIFSRNDYATKSGVLFQKNNLLLTEREGRTG